MCSETSSGLWHGALGPWVESSNPPHHLRKQGSVQEGELGEGREDSRT